MIDIKKLNLRNLNIGYFPPEIVENSPENSFLVFIKDLMFLQVL